MQVEIRVELDAAAQADPAVVWFGSRRLPVNAVLDRWWGPGMRWWKVDTDDGPYILRRSEHDSRWELAAVPRG